MTRNEFIFMKIPNIPYLSAHRGPSTGCIESFYMDTEKGVRLNIFWKTPGSVSIWLHNNNEKNKRKQNKVIIEKTESINPDDILSICEKHLR